MSYVGLQKRTMRATIQQANTKQVRISLNTLATLYFDVTTRQGGGAYMRTPRPSREREHTII